MEKKKRGRLLYLQHREMASFVYMSFLCPGIFSDCALPGIFIGKL